MLELTERGEPGAEGVGEGRRLRRTPAVRMVKTINGSAKASNPMVGDDGGGSGKRYVEYTIAADSEL